MKGNIAEQNINETIQNLLNGRIANEPELGAKNINNSTMK